MCRSFKGSMLAAMIIEMTSNPDKSKGTAS
jgi:hypothetical protein